MAGIGEVCSHVGAVLFYIDAQIRLRENKTITDKKAYWMLPSTINKVQFKSVQAMDFTSAKSKKRKLDDSIETSLSEPSCSYKQRKMPEVPVPTKTDLDSLFKNLYDRGSKSAILAIVPEYAEAYQPKALNPKLPFLLTELSDDEFRTMSKDESEKKIQDVFER